MDFGEWTFKLHENPGMICIDLWAFRKVLDKRQVLTHDGTVKTYELQAQPDPGDYFIRFEDREQLTKLANALASFGVKSSNDHKNEGLLEATRSHLEDMRLIALNRYKQEGK